VATTIETDMVTLVKARLNTDPYTDVAADEYVSRVIAVDEPRRSLALPYLVVDVREESQPDSFAAQIVRVRVLVHVFTDRDKGKDRQRAIAAELSDSLRGWAADGTSWSFSPLKRHGGQQGPSSGKELHWIESYSTYARR
jgi:hypothetical protein